jgi:hypothetical protein
LCFLISIATLNIKIFLSKCAFVIVRMNFIQSIYHTFLKFLPVIVSNAFQWIQEIQYFLHIILIFISCFFINQLLEIYLRYHFIVISLLSFLRLLIWSHTWLILIWLKI